jgi:hypothetical protein
MQHAIGTLKTGLTQWEPYQPEILGSDNNAFYDDDLDRVHAGAKRRVYSNNPIMRMLMIQQWQTQLPGVVDIIPRERHRSWGNVNDLLHFVVPLPWGADKLVYWCAAAWPIPKDLFVGNFYLGAPYYEDELVETWLKCKAFGSVFGGLMEFPAEKCFSVVHNFKTSRDTVYVECFLGVVRDSEWTKRLRAEQAARGLGRV